MSDGLVRPTICRDDDHAIGPPDEWPANIGWLAPKNLQARDGSWYNPAGVLYCDDPACSADLPLSVNTWHFCPACKRVWRHTLTLQTEYSSQGWLDLLGAAPGKSVRTSL
jgi:hypothetical protein